MQPNPYLALSSTFLILPAIVSYYANYKYLSLGYYTMSFVSLIYHSTKFPPILYIDIPLSHVLNVWTIVNIYPGGWRTLPYYSVVILYIFITYYFGQSTKTLIWDSDVNVATKWHMMMHLLCGLVSSYSIHQVPRQMLLEVQVEHS